MGDISLDMIQEFFSLKPLTKTNTLTPAKISGRWNVPTQTNAFQQEFKLPKKTNPQRQDMNILSFCLVFYGLLFQHLELRMSAKRCKHCKQEYNSCTLPGLPICGRQQEPAILISRPTGYCSRTKVRALSYLKIVFCNLAQGQPLQLFDQLQAWLTFISGAPNEKVVQNHLNIALLNAFQYLNGRYRNIFFYPLKVFHLFGFPS